MKNYYNQAKELEIAEIRLESLQERLVKLEAKITSCTSELKEMTGSGNFSNDKIDQFVIKKIILENEISIQKDEIAILKRDLEKMRSILKQIKGIEKDIFVLAHIEGYYPTKIAAKIPCSLSTVYRYLEKINDRIAS